MDKANLPKEIRDAIASHKPDIAGAIQRADVKTLGELAAKSREAEMAELLEERRIMQGMLDAALDNAWTRTEPGEYREAIAFIDHRLALLSTSEGGA